MSLNWTRSTVTLFIVLTNAVYVISNPHVRPAEPVRVTLVTQTKFAGSHWKTLPHRLKSLRENSAVG